MDIQNRNVTAFIGKTNGNMRQRSTKAANAVSGNVVSKRLAYFGFLRLVSEYYPDVRTTADLETLDSEVIATLAKTSIDCTSVFSDVWDNEYIENIGDIHGGKFGKAAA